MRTLGSEAPLRLSHGDWAYATIVFWYSNELDGSKQRFIHSLERLLFASVLQNEARASRRCERPLPRAISVRWHGRSPDGPALNPIGKDFIAASISPAEKSNCPLGGFGVDGTGLLMGGNACKLLVDLLVVRGRRSAEFCKLLTKSGRELQLGPCAELPATSRRWRCPPHVATVCCGYPQLVSGAQLQDAKLVGVHEQYR